MFEYSNNFKQIVSDLVGHKAWPEGCFRLCMIPVLHTDEQFEVLADRLDTLSPVMSPECQPCMLGRSCCNTLQSSAPEHAATLHVGVALCTGFLSVTSSECVSCTFDPRCCGAVRMRRRCTWVRPTAPASPLRTAHCRAAMAATPAARRTATR